MQMQREKSGNANQPRAKAERGDELWSPHFLTVSSPRRAVLTFAPINSLIPTLSRKNYLRKFLSDSLRMLHDSQQQIIPLSCSNISASLQFLSFISQQTVL